MRILRLESAAEMGKAAAAHVAGRLRELAASHSTVSVLFATGASQLETLRALTAMPDIPWQQIVGFHMDEYLGISPDHPASFRFYLKKQLISKVPMREFHFVDGSASDPEAFADRYAALLKERPPLLCLAGIGENGHLAFNDPPVADFSDPKSVKIVELDQDCRQQQVNEGWFGTLAEVPRQAITVTIPLLMSIPELIVSVPGYRKASVVTRTLNDPVSTSCPSTILRNHPGATIYLDRESGG